MGKKKRRKPTQLSLPGKAFTRTMLPPGGSDSCRRCKRPLRDARWRALGVGPKCAVWLGIS
jgi:hypothetical protein